MRCGAVFTFIKPYGAVRGGSVEQFFPAVRLSVHRS